MNYYLLYKLADEGRTAEIKQLCEEHIKEDLFKQWKQGNQKPNEHSINCDEQGLIYGGVGSLMLGAQTEPLHKAIEPEDCKQILDAVKDESQSEPVIELPAKLPEPEVSSAPVKKPYRSAPILIDSEKFRAMVEVKAASPVKKHQAEYLGFPTASRLDLFKTKGPVKTKYGKYLIETLGESIRPIKAQRKPPILTGED